MNRDQMEKAARELCKIRGQDPEKLMMDDNGYWNPQYLYSWDEIHQYLQVKQAVESVE